MQKAIVTGISVAWVFALCFAIGGIVGSCSRAYGQYYYSPTPPTYYQYPGGVINPQYQMDVNNYLWQNDADRKAEESRNEWIRTKKWRESDEYRNPWSYKQTEKKTTTDP
jgi:hypothetical protein